MKIIISESQYKLLKEGSLATELMNQVRENGWLETAELVGGAENLLSIVGKSKVNVLNFLMSYFKNLRVVKRGGDVLLMDQGLPILQKSSWGLPLIVYRSYLEARVPDKNIPLLRHYIEDFVRELVLLYPQLYSNNAEIFGDSGLYDRYGTFEL